MSIDVSQVGVSLSLSFLTFFYHCTFPGFPFILTFRHCLNRYHRPFKEVRPEFEAAPYYEPPEFHYGGRGGGRGRGRFGQRKDYGPGGAAKEYYDNYAGSRYMINLHKCLVIRIIRSAKSFQAPVWKLIFHQIH